VQSKSRAHGKDCGGGREIKGKERKGVWGVGVLTSENIASMCQATSACELTCLIQCAYCQSSHIINIIMVPNHWPATWIESTFTSRAKTEELLRPELDHSLLQTDFEKAVEVFPTIGSRWSVRLPILANFVSFLIIAQSVGGIMAATVACCGIALCKPKWPITRITTWAALAGGVGSPILGECLRFRRHIGFIQSLEDKNGFFSSLSNVRTRELMALGIEQEAVGFLGEGGQSGTESTCGSSYTYLLTLL
jgi:hypothetical protein